MSFLDDHYGNYGGLNAAEYVDKHVRGSSEEMLRIAETIRLIPSESTSVLDVGAGHGVLLKDLESARGIRGVGIEITPSKVEYARAQGVDLRLGAAQRLEFSDRSFDTVLACEVVEHLPFGVYEASLKEMARVARHSVLITVPNEEQRPFVRCPYCGASVNPNYHMRSFSTASLTGLVPGFSLIKTIGVGSHRVSPLLSLGRRWLDRQWPAELVCASCGFQSTPTSSASATPLGRLALRKTARDFARLLPARRKATWLIALYVLDTAA